MKTPALAIDHIGGRIIEVRGQKVLLDSELAALYGVTTRRLNEQVKRNIERFPPDFMFQLSAVEKAWVVANCDHLTGLRFSPNLPRAFTEHGAIMAATLLNAPRAVEVSVYVVRAFIRLRELVTTHRDLARKLEELEKRVGEHDEAVVELVRAIRQLMATPKQKTRRIGFQRPSCPR